MSTEQQTAARSFHACGDALTALGRRLSFSGGELASLGRQMLRIEPGELVPGNLLKLRQPLDKLRDVVDVLEDAARMLRELFDGLTTIVGVDN